MSDLKERVLTAIVFVIVLIGSIIFNEYSVSFLFFIIILLGQIEFYNFFKPTNIKPQKVVGVIGGLVFFSISAFSIFTPININSIFLIIPIVFLIFVVELYRKKPQPISNISFTILGIIYISVPFTLLHHLAYYSDSGFGDRYQYQILLGYFFILWANDTGAYFVGRSIGKRPLFPSISPKKTWEGFFGGAITAIAIGFLNAAIFPQLSQINWLIISSIIVVFGSLGDLVESMFKRSLEMKDSGKILPGHGGILDRFDGIFISAPMVYIFLKFLSFI